jgi:outer membrane receptor protein involved in Fe transport
MTLRSIDLDSSPRLSDLALSIALACMAQPALAQTEAAPVVVVKPSPIKKEDKAEPPPAAASGEPSVEASVVTVAGNRPTNRIDRQVYDVTSDVSASNGSAADALNTVPSVVVDPDGTLTLRGSTNVQILIDGKPSAMLQGDNRGATLNSIPAEDIESIEVINNPGAQFGNQGGGGPIINIIMKRTRKPGGFGALNANTGSAGRHNAALSGSYNTGRLGVQGGMNARRDGRDSVAAADRTRIDPLTGLPSHSTVRFQSRGLNDAAGFNAALNYNWGDKDTLGANLAHNRSTNKLRAEDRYVNYGQDNITDSEYLRTTLRGGVSDNTAWGARYDHKGAINGELMKLDLRASSAINTSDSAYANAFSIRPAGTLDTQSLQGNRTEIRIVDFTGDYERPDDSGFLKLGYKVSRHKNSFDILYTNIDPLTLAHSTNALRSNRFELDDGNLALYGSYQLRLNENWGVLAGLRTEYSRMDVAQLTSAIEATNRDFNVIPSFFVSYKASALTNIRFSYAHRIRRPNANDLNPFVVYRDEFNVSSGNPNLKPIETDSFELGYETRYGTLDTNLRGYYRKDSGLISERKVFISDTVLLTTRDNSGSNRAGGLEFTVSGKLLPKLTINTSGNLAYIEQRIFSGLTGLYTQRSANALSGRARLNFQATEQDLLQLTLNAQGKALTAAGFRAPNSTANVSLRHTLTPALSLVFNVTDVFKSNKIETITDTVLLKESAIRRFDGRVMYFGLTYRLGGVGAPGPRRPAN